MDPKPEPGPPPAEMLSTVELLERARAGDGRAVNRLCERYLPPLRRWASRRLPPWARGLLDTDDLVQETLLGTVQHVQAFEPRRDGAFHAYLRQALQNRIRNEMRNALRRPRSEEFDGHEEDPAPSPLEETVGREALERYEAALARLREEDREAVVARVELDLSYAEMAEALGKPSPDAARVAVGRALVRLAQEMRSERGR